MKYFAIRKYIILLLSAVVFMMAGGLAHSKPEKIISSELPRSLTVASSNSFPPINMLDKQGELTGFGRDISDAALGSLGIKLNRKHSPVWTDVLDWLATEKIDFIHDTGYTMDRDKYLDYTVPIIEMPEMIFVKAERLDINTLESLNGKVVACVNKHITHLYLQQFPGIKCHIVNKPIEGVYALMGGSVDAFVYPREIVMYFAQQLRASRDIKMVGEPLRVLSWSMTVKEGNTQLIQILNKGINNIKNSGEYNRIYNKWFGKRLLAGYTEGEVRIIVLAVVLISLFVGVSIVLYIYNRRLSLAKQALEQSEEKYSEIARHVPGAVFQICKKGDEECSLEFVSQGLANSIGVTGKRLLGNINKLMEYILTEDRIRFKQSLLASISNHSRWEVEFRVKTVEQDVLWFRASSSPITMANETTIFNGILVNISDVKELQQRQDHFFELSNNMLCIAGFDGYFKLLNPSWVNMLGYSMQELKSEPFVSFVHPDDRDDTIAEAARLSERKGHTINFKNRYRCKNGEYRYLNWMAVSSPYADEIYAAAHDITDLKNAEQELKRAHDNLEARVEQRTFELKESNSRLQLAEQNMRLAKEDADRANNAKTVFLSNMSHELRTPLNAILGFSQLLEADPKLIGSEQAEFAKEIRQAGNHLLDLINEILDLSKIDSGKMEIISGKVDLSNLLEDCVSIIKPLADARELQVKQVSLSKGVYVYGDKLRLKQVLLNLLSNAVKYNQDKGSITLDYSVEGDNLSLSVTDTGKGMTQSEMKELFQPFNRLGVENSGIEGTGIGLVISKRLIELMGGDLTVKSTPNEGSCFTVRILKGETTAEDLVSGIEKQPQPVATGLPAPVDARILYIEDNAANAHLMEKIIESISSNKLLIASTAKDGLNVLASQPVDLILLDIHLPDMDGYEVLECIKKDKIIKNIPVIAVTADAMEASYERGMKAGFREYLSKPINVPQLQQLIYDILNETKVRTASR